MLNALPSSVSNQVARVEQTIKAWPIPLSIDQAIKWVLQFDRDYLGLALRLIENLDVLSQRDIRSAFDIAQAKLERAAVEKGSPIKSGNTLYAGIGQAAKSGAVMAYHYRVTAEIAESDFFVQEEGAGLDFAKVDNIVLLDDVIGTGRAVAAEVSLIAEQVHSLARSRNVFVLTVAGYENGIGNVVEKTGASVICALEYSSKDTVADLDAEFYSQLPMSERSRTLDRIKRYCRLASRSDLGFGGVGGLLVFDHNTPNTTLPLVWAHGNGWTPLFPRAAKLHGSAKVLKVVEDERASATQDAIAEPPPARSAVDLTLFVEGKFDELFVDVMRARFALAARLGVADVSAVALGGLAQSGRMIELLTESRKYAVFVLDGDEYSLRVSERIKVGRNIRTLSLRPTFAAMLDVDRIFADSRRFQGLPDPAGDRSDRRWMRDFEFAVFKRRPITGNSERLSQIIEEYLDVARYEVFVESLRAVVDQLVDHD